MKDWRVMQGRGKHNLSSDHHDAIMEVINNNMVRYQRFAQ